MFTWISSCLRILLVTGIGTITIYFKQVYSSVYYTYMHECTINSQFSFLICILKTHMYSIYRVFRKSFDKIRWVITPIKTKNICYRTYGHIPLWVAENSWYTKGYGSGFESSRSLVWIPINISHSRKKQHWNTTRKHKSSHLQSILKL